MNANILIRYFNRITETPDAVPRLRAFILDLAVRGKLVEQDPDDTPASELLDQITEARCRLMTAGKLKRTQELPDIEYHRVDRLIPNGWISAPLGAVYDIRDGTHDTPKYVDTGYPLITSKNLSAGRLSFTDAKFISEQDHRKISERSLVERFDVLLPMIGSIGNPVVVDTDRPFSIKNVAVFKYYDRNLADCGYLCLFLQHATARMRQLAAGGLQPFVSLTFLRGYPLLLPPLAEQRRIVIKAGELMVLCDQLEEAHGQQTLRKRSLTVAVHRQLKETDEKLLASASFLVEHLPRLTATREQIQHLRQTILTLAIRGKLVPQSPNDTCAGDTLGHRVLHSPLTEKSPWTLPAGWKWTSLGLIGETLGGGTPAKANLDYWSGPIPWVSPKDMKVHYISDAEDHISEAAVESSAAKLIPPGSVLVVVRGMILAHSFPAAISMVPLAINQDMKAIVPFRPDISPMLLLAMRALKPNVIQMVQRSTHGTCKLLTEDLLSLPIPFPPLEEQSRIVEKVDELIRMCDELDVLLDSSRVRRSRLLDSVLDHSLRDDALSQHSLLALGATDTPTIIRSIACQSPSP